MARLILAVLAVALLTTGCGDGPVSVDQLNHDGDYAAAEALARRHLAELEQRGAGAVEIAQTIDGLVTALFRAGKGQLDETRELAERAVRLNRESGPPSADLASSLVNLGLLRVTGGAVDEARELFEESLSIRTDVLPENHPDLAESLDFVGGVLNAQGHHAEARPHHERALAIREAAFGPDSYEVSLTLSNFLAPLLWQSGDYAGAKPLYERALAIRQSELGPDHLSTAGVLNNLAMLEYDMGDDAAASEHFGAALAIREGSLEREHPLVASTMSNLAHVLWRRQELDAAHRLATEALELMEGVPEPSDEDIGLVLDLLGRIAASRSDHGEARRLYERAIARMTEALGPEHPAIAVSLHGMGTALRRDGDADASREAFQRAVEIWTTNFGPDHPSAAASRKGLAVALFDLGDEAGALRSGLAAEASSRKHLRLTARAFAEAQSLRYAAVRESGLDLVLTLASTGRARESTSDILEAVVQSRAMVLDELGARRRSLALSEDPEIGALLQEFIQSGTRLANQLVRASGDPRDQAERIEQARRQKEAAEEKLARHSSWYRREQALELVDLDRVRASLPRGGVLVSVARYGHREPGAAEPVPSYIAMVLGRSGRPQILPLGRAEEIEPLVESWRAEVALRAPSARQGLAAAEEQYRKVGADLRRRVWDPVAAAIGTAKLVFYVPDGALNTVSLAALPTADGRFLVEFGPTVHYLSAERDLVLLQQGGDPTSGGELLAMGAPDFGPSPPGDAQRRSCATLGDVRFPALPDAADEVAEIGEMWTRAHGPEAIVVTGADATEERFKHDAPGKRIVHLATHGFFLDGQCRGGEGTRSFELSGVEELDPPAAATDSPLLLAGLAFADANQRAAAAADEQDGVLTAEEIVTLDLGGVEWVVLSACDTGLGEIRNGEGVLGLRRSFQVAGAKTLIMSLWSVDDRATRQWMAALYRARFDGASTAEAVRAASRASLERRREGDESTHPFFWAAFVATGDWS